MNGRTFGILSPFVGGDYYGAIIEGIGTAAVAGGDRAMAVQTLDPGSHSVDRSGLPEFHRPLAWRHLSGLAVLPGAVGPEYAQAARRAGIPVVMVATEISGEGTSVVATEISGESTSVVATDNRSGVRDAVAHRVAVLLMDLDGFKAVNDSLGHAAGDQLLVQVARRLSGLLRRTDTVVRLGGDEFVVLIDDVSGPGGDCAVRAGIEAAVTEPCTIDGHVVELGAGIGSAVSGDALSDPDLLLREADAAMYRAKSVSRRR